MHTLLSRLLGSLLAGALCNKSTYFKKNNSSILHSKGTVRFSTRKFKQLETFSLEVQCWFGDHLIQKPARFYTEKSLETPILGDWGRGCMCLHVCKNVHLFFINHLPFYSAVWGIIAPDQLFFCLVWSFWKDKL